MAKVVRQLARLFWVGVPLALVVLVLALPKPRASGGTYSTPYWSNTASVTECVCDGCGSCGGDRPSVFSPEGVSLLDGHLSRSFFLFDTPGRVAFHPFGIGWSSRISGVTQVGRGMVLSTEHTLEIGANETPVTWRRPDGLIVTYTKSGGIWSASDCNVHTTLTKNAGKFVLTEKTGETRIFDANGMPYSFADANGNALSFTYNGSLQWTGLTDDLGRTYTIHHNANGFIDYIEDPASRRWSLGYDSSDSLTTITTPATPDQANGITTTLGYDGYNRLVSEQDGRGTTIREYAYVGASGPIDYVEINHRQIDFTWGTNQVERTDRNSNVHRWSTSGSNVTKHEIKVTNQWVYPTEWRYSGNDLVTIVYPRGNLVDLTLDGNDNVTERRRRTADTSTNAASDIVESWTYSSNRVATYTDPLGNQRSYTRDSAGNVTSITFPTVTSPATQTASKGWTYNGYGQVTQSTDEENGTVAYSYFASGSNAGLLEKIEVDPSGLDLETVFGYGAAGDRTSVTDPRGYVFLTTYDALRRVTQTDSPAALGYQVKFSYDGNGNLVSREVKNLDKDGTVDANNPWLTTSYTYTPEDWMASMTEEIDATHTRTTSWDHDYNGNRTRVTKPEGNKEAFVYDERDLVIQAIHGETSAVETTEEMTYDANGNLVELTGGRGYTTGFTVDLFDRRTRTTNYLGHYEEVEYDKAGHVVTVTKKNSSDTSLQRRYNDFDERGRPWRTRDLFKDPGTTYSDAVTTIARYKTGEPYTVTNPRGKTTTYTIDAAHRVVAVEDSMGNEVTRVFDDGGNLTGWTISEVDGQSTVSHEYEATFDAIGRRATMTEIDRLNSQHEITTTYKYDSRSNLVWILNALGNPTRFTFDGVGRMTKKEVALAYGSPIENFTSAIVTQWGFDLNNRLVSFKDDAQNESTWAYDAQDRPTSMSYPDDSHIDYEYDDQGNVVVTTDAAGNVIEDEFDALDRRIGRDVTRATGFLDTTTETFGYDALNRLTLAEDDDYKVEFTYGVLGLSSMPYEEKQSYTGANAYTKTVTKTYNANGLVWTEAYPSDANLSLVRTYNDIDQQAAISDGTNTIASWSYIGTRPKVVTFQSGATQTNTYTGFRNEVGTIHHQTSGSSTILRLDYGYNDLHDRTYERFGASGSSGDAFEYDKARRLTKAWMGSSTPSSPSGNAYVKTIVYNMDDDGNRTSVVTTPYQQSASTESYTTNTLNQYTAVGGTSQAHDGNGNLSDNGTYKFKYNYKNLIAEVRRHSDDGLVATYLYDALGRRVKKAVSGGVTERYVYSGLETVATYDASSAWKQSFVFGQSIDEVLMLEQADVLDFDSDQNTSELTRSFYHRNALGSVMDITDAAQGAVESYRYDPYGELTITRNGQVQSGDILGQHWSFAARFRDEETGLYHQRKRSYCARQGVFLQRDPKGHNPDPHFYRYARGNPTTLIDPMGTDALDSFLGDVQQVLEAGVFSPGEIDVIRSTARLANALSGIVPGKGEDDARDAMRHCMWMCYMVQLWPKDGAFPLGREFGAVEGATRAGDIHERAGKTAGNPEGGSAMDQANNVEGRNCGQESNECWSCCYRKLRSGQLTSAIGGVYAKYRIDPWDPVKPRKCPYRGGPYHADPSDPMM